MTPGGTKGMEPGARMMSCWFVKLNCQERIVSLFSCKDEKSRDNKHAKVTCLKIIVPCICLVKVFDQINCLAV